jgi:hypothetical protein
MTTEEIERLLVNKPFYVDPRVLPYLEAEFIVSRYFCERDQYGMPKIGPEPLDYREQFWETWKIRGADEVQTERIWDEFLRRGGKIGDETWKDFVDEVMGWQRKD